MNNINFSDKIHITSYGHTGLPLVMFHGWGFDQYIWHSLVSELVIAGYHVYLVDLPGFGSSELLTWEEFKQLILARLPQNFAVLGWSMGGLFATRLALEEPKRITHLISVASSPKFVETHNWPGVKADILQKFYQQVCLDPRKTLGQFVQLQLRGQKQSTSFSYEPKIEQNAAQLNGLKHGLDVLLTWDFRQDLHQLEIPTSYFFGYFDTITSRAIMQTMQNEYPQFNYKMFADAAHIPFLSHRCLFIDELVKLVP